MHTKNTAIIYVAIHDDLFNGELRLVYGHPCYGVIGSEKSWRIQYVHTNARLAIIVIGQRIITWRISIVYREIMFRVHTYTNAGKWPYLTIKPFGFWFYHVWYTARLGLILHSSLYAGGEKSGLIPYMLQCNLWGLEAGSPK